MHLFVTYFRTDNAENQTVYCTLAGAYIRELQICIVPMTQQEQINSTDTQERTR